MSKQHWQYINDGVYDDIIVDDSYNAIAYYNGRKGFRMVEPTITRKGSVSFHNHTSMFKLTVWPNKEN